jgi:hypothetical protein
MANGESGKHSWIFVALVVGAVAFLIWMGPKIFQVVQPFPGKPAPVVPKLPDLAAELSKIKSLCESRALEAKGSLRGPRAKKQLETGQKLYGEAKAESDAAIRFLVTGLAARFNEDDEAKIAARMQTLGKKVSAFLNWADSLENRKGMGAEDPLSAVISLLGDWIKAVGQENEEAIKKITASLEECRLLSWDKLKPRGESDASAP